MLDGIMTKLGLRKPVQEQQLGEVSRVKKSEELVPKVPDKLVRSPKTDTFTSSNSVKEQQTETEIENK